MNSGKNMDLGKRGVSFFALFLIIMAIVSCESTKPDEASFVINYERTPSVCFFEAFDFELAELVFLQDGDGALLSSNLSIVKGEENFVVFDKSQNQVFLFDDEGQLVRMIGRHGRGPAEYFNPSFIDADFEQEEIYVLGSNGHVITRYSLGGNYLGSIETPVYASSFASAGGNLFFSYAGYYGDPDGYRVHLFEDTTLLHSLLPLNTAALDVIEANFFPSSDNTGLFREALFPEIYVYGKDGLSELLRFDFGRWSVTEADIVNAGDPFSFFERINNSGFATTRSAHLGSQFIVVQTMQQANNTSVGSYFVVNSNSRSAVKVSSNKPNGGFSEEDFQSLHLFAIDNNDVAYFFASPDIINQDFFKMQSGAIESANLADHENPVIVKVPISH